MTERTFIDLFAGISGHHTAVNEPVRLGYLGKRGQVGNSIPVPIVEAIVRQLVRQFNL